MFIVNRLNQLLLFELVSVLPSSTNKLSVGLTTEAGIAVLVFISLLVPCSGAGIAALSMLPLDPLVEVLRRADDIEFLLAAFEVLVAEEPEVFAAVVTGADFAAAFFGAAFFAAAFLGATFLGVVFLAAAFFGANLRAGFFAAAFFGAAFFGAALLADLKRPDFFAAAFFGAAFLAPLLAVAFFGAAFLAPLFIAAFFGAAFLAAPLRNDRLAAVFFGAIFLDGAFFAAVFEEDLPPELFFAAFFAAAFLVDFAIGDGFLNESRINFCLQNTMIIAFVKIMQIVVDDLAHLNTGKTSIYL